MTFASASRPWPGTLDWGSDWFAEAAADLAHLGFELRDGSRPRSIPGPRLLVAFRDVPTLEHFDPEEATYWEANAGRCRLATVNARHPTPASVPFAWGRIRVADRVPVSNEFLAFGGTLLVGARDQHTVLAAFTSRAPIVRWAGHSQGVDPLTDEIGAFFARLMVPVDFQQDAETRIAATAPEALYAAFLAHTFRRLGPGSRLRASDPAFSTMISHESKRLEHDVPAAWQAGEELLGWLELG